jgi:hypothetical protein
MTAEAKIKIDTNSEWTRLSCTRHDRSSRFPTAPNEWWSVVHEATDLLNLTKERRKASAFSTGKSIEFAHSAFAGFSSWHQCHCIRDGSGGWGSSPPTFRNSVETKRGEGGGIRGKKRRNRKKRGKEKRAPKPAVLASVSDWIPARLYRNLTLLCLHLLLHCFPLPPNPKGRAAAAAHTPQRETQQWCDGVLVVMGSVCAARDALLSVYMHCVQYIEAIFYCPLIRTLLSQSHACTPTVNDAFTQAAAVQCTATTQETLHVKNCK